MSDERPVVRTTSGPVRGTRGPGGTARFLSIPYAAGPSGGDRFRPPRPHAPWTGIREAGAAGPTAPQAARSGFGVLDMSWFFGPGWCRGEDYLTVDIWAPAPQRQPAPVLVFLHGGGFVAGSTRAPVYDGAAFARDGVVFVAVNFRLGIPGFLHVPDAPDNRGLLDVLAALRWLHDNVGAFGGDPAAVTLSGQSSGAVLVAGVLADAASAGLVRRAILQSGSGVGAQTPEQGELVAQAAARALGVPATARSLAALPDERLVDAVPSLAGLDLTTATHRAPLGRITPFSLVLEQQPVVALSAGRSADVDVLAGTTSDEGALYLASVGLLGGTDADVYAVAAQFHDRPGDLVAAYRLERPDATPQQLRTKVLGDGLFGTGTRRLLQAHATGPGRTFRYQFAWRSNAVDGHLGACHTLELPFVFERTGLASLHGPQGLLGTVLPPAGLTQAVHGAWARFTTTGDPGQSAVADLSLAPVTATTNTSDVDTAWDATS